MKKRILALLLAILMVTALLPLQAMAENDPAEEVAAAEPTPAPETEEGGDGVGEAPALTEEDPEVPAAEPEAGDPEEPAGETGGEAEEAEPAEAEELFLEEAGLQLMSPGGIAIDATNFPDVNFRTYVRSLFDGADSATAEQFAAVTTINVSKSSSTPDSDKIASLQGIEYFTGLQILYCSYNSLTVLNLSSCSSLEDLYCYNNALTALNLSSCTNLGYLDCGSNSLTALDLSGCPDLANLNCSYNSLTALDLRGRTNLEYLYCGSNSLTALDLSGCTNLKSLYCTYCDALTALNLSSCSALTSVYCDNCALTTLDLSGCAALEELYCYSNDLTALSLSSCTGLKELYCSSNDLTALSLGSCTNLEYLNCNSNDLTELDLSSCTWLKSLDCRYNNITALNLTNNPYLTGEAVFCDAGVTVTYSTGIPINAVTFPDANFRACVKSLFDGADSATVEAFAAVTEINVAKDYYTSAADRIASLQGIRFFTGLKSLNCSYNSLTALDVSACTELRTLICDHNALTSLNVSGCTKLENLTCSDNTLTELDVHSFAYLEELRCDSNDLTSLNVTCCTALKYLNCNNNQLTNLALRDCTALETLYCGSNLLTNLDLFDCTMLKYLACGVNPFTTLNPGNCPALETLYCNYCNEGAMSALDVTRCPALKELCCSANSLTSLNLSKCTELVALECQENSLTALDLSKCTKLKGLTCYDNHLTALDLSHCAALEELDCEQNSITSLDLTGCPLLTEDGVNCDAGVTVEYCGAIAIDESNFPDPNFRAYVKSLFGGADSAAGTQFAAVTTINVSKSSSTPDSDKIASLQGIEYFVGLESLNCSGNALTSLNLSGCEKLKTLFCYGNALTALDVSTCKALEELQCHDNAITELDLLSNPLMTLEKLQCDAGVDVKIHVWIQINAANFPDEFFRAYVKSLFHGADSATAEQFAAVTTINVSKSSSTSDSDKIASLQGIEYFTGLKVLYCAYNSLTVLNLSSCSSLEDLYCYNNALTALNLSSCTNLGYLDCGSNSLTALDLSGCTNLEYLSCSYNSLTALDLSGRTNLEYLYCGSNSLTALDLSGCTNLKLLYCTYCDALTALNLSSCSALTYVDCDHCALTKLDLSGCAALEELYCYANDLTALSLSSCTGLKTLSCSSNDLTALDLSSCTALKELSCSSNDLTELNLRECVLLTPDKVSADLKTKIYYYRPSAFSLSPDSIILAPGKTEALPALPAELGSLASRVTWKAVKEDYETASDLLIIDTLLGSFTTAADKSGTAYIRASLPYGADVYSAYCRVDVTDGALTEAPGSKDGGVTGYKLPENKVTVELFKTDYTGFELVPVMLQLTNDSKHMFMAAPAGKLRPEAELDIPEVPADNDGVSIKSARFAEGTAAGLFELRVLSDRRVEIVPRYTAMESAWANPKSVKSSYRSAVEVTLSNGVTYTTPEALTVTVKQSKPSLKAGALKFNSYALATVRSLSPAFTGGTVMAAALDPSVPLPAWLSYNEAKMSLTYEGAAGAKLSGSVQLLVTAEGWALQMPVTVKVSAAPINPAFSITKSVTLRAGTADTAVLTGKITPAEYAALPITVLDQGGFPGTVTASGNVVTLKAPATDDGEAHSYKLVLSAAGKNVTVTVKTTTAAKNPVKLTLKASGAIDLTTGSPLKLTPTLSNYNKQGKGYADLFTLVSVKGNKKGEAEIDKTDAFKASYAPAANLISLTANNILDPSYTYTATFAYGSDATGSVSFKVKESVPDKVKPSFTVKASGSLDVLRPGTQVKLTPTVKNCYDYTLSGNDLTFYRKDGKVWTALTYAEKNSLFTVTVSGGAWIITGNAALASGSSYGVTAELTLRGYACTASKPTAPVALKVTQGKAVLTQSTKTGTLYLADRFSDARVTLSFADPKLKGIAGVELDTASAKLFDLADLGGGQYAIGWKGDRISALKAGSSKTVKLNVFMAGNGGTKANAVVSVKLTIR